MEIIFKKGDRVRCIKLLEDTPIEIGEEFLVERGIDQLFTSENGKQTTEFMAVIKYKKPFYSEYHKKIFPGLWINLYHSYFELVE